jgi:zinc transporter ZupT
MSTLNHVRQYLHVLVRQVRVCAHFLKIFWKKTLSSNTQPLFVVLGFRKLLAFGQALEFWLENVRGALSIIAINMLGVARARRPTQCAPNARVRGSRGCRVFGS